MNSLETLVAPAARIEDLVITESGNELLVFDTQRNELHQLDQLSATVWRQLDGRSTEGDILQATKAALGDHVTADSIQLAIIGLGKANLLSGQISSSLSDRASSRRRFLKKAGAVAAIPVIASVTAPMATSASSVCLGCDIPEVLEIRVFRGVPNLLGLAARLGALLGSYDPCSPSSCGSCVPVDATLVSVDLNPRGTGIAVIGFVGECDTTPPGNVIAALVTAIIAVLAGLDGADRAAPLNVEEPASLENFDQETIVVEDEQTVPEEPTPTVEPQVEPEEVESGDAPEVEPAATESGEIESPDEPQATEVPVG